MICKNNKSTFFCCAQIVRDYFVYGSKEAFEGGAVEGGEKKKWANESPSAAN